jgi:DNA-binding NarL/FixJ family response regulator
MTSTNPQETRIVIADDHLPIRVGLVSLLELLPGVKVVGQATDGLGAVELVKSLKPDIVLLDLRMPRMDGIECTLVIRRETPTCKVLVLTTFDEDEDVYRAFQAGVDGYLLKGFSKDELEHSITVIMEGKRFLPPPIARKLADRALRPELTPRELDTLRQIVLGRSNKEIARGMGITEDTVKSHLKSIFVKLNVSDRTQAVTEALKNGLIRLQ